MTYAQARLLLGISAVGTTVVLATTLLATDLVAIWGRGVAPDWGSQILLLLAFVGCYAALQLPFDILGGLVLPRRFGRPTPTTIRFFTGLARGVVVQAALLVAVAASILATARVAGLPGVLVLAIGTMLLLTALQPTLARWVGRIHQTRSDEPSPADGAGFPVETYRAEDPGFTGGVVGLVAPRLLLPQRWRDQLSPADVHLAIDRKRQVVAQKGWLRGRILAFAWNLAGIALAASWIGGARLGNAGGVIELSLAFTCWSFLGLLLLPTPSRWGVLETDRRAADLADSRRIQALVEQIDALQDGERSRSKSTESIFHPIPSLESRQRALAGAHPPPTGWWNAARLAIFLSWAGLGLLGRAVHCNCGRPDLWVMLPTD